MKRKKIKNIAAYPFLKFYHETLNYGIEIKDSNIEH